MMTTNRGTKRPLDIKTEYFYDYYQEKDEEEKASLESQIAALQTQLKNVTQSHPELIEKLTATELDLKTSEQVILSQQAELNKADGQIEGLKQEVSTKQVKCSRLEQELTAEKEKSKRLERQIQTERSQRNKERLSHARIMEALKIKHQAELKAMTENFEKTKEQELTKMAHVWDAQLKDIEKVMNIALSCLPEDVSPPTNVPCFGLSS